MKSVIFFVEIFTKNLMLWLLLAGKKLGKSLFKNVINFFIFRVKQIFKTRKKWRIAWLLWMHRNTHLHQLRHSVHPQQEEHLNDEIIHEHTLGLNGLSPEYQSMFNTPINSILKRSIHHKINWIFSIWTAREATNPAYLTVTSIPHPNTTLRFKYVQWKERIL